MRRICGPSMPLKRLRIVRNSALASSAVASELANASPPSGGQPMRANHVGNKKLKATLSNIASVPISTGVFVSCCA